LVVGLLAALHAGIFGTAASVLPWDSGSSFAWTAGGLALSHAMVLFCAVGMPGHLPKAWRLSSGLALVMLALWGYWTASSATYLIGLYGSLGQGLAGAAAAAFAPVVLLTLPFASWGWVATSPSEPRLSSKQGAAAGTAALALVAFGLGQSRASASAQPLPTPRLGAQDLERGRLEFDELAIGNGGARRYTHHGTKCTEPVLDTRLATALVVFQDKRDDQGRSSSGRCVQAPPDALVEAINALLAQEARQAVVKIDIVTGAQRIPSAHGALDPLKVRPGLDGVCAGSRCLAPWQLVAHDQFTRFKPIPFIQDLRIGVEPNALFAALSPVRDDEVAPAMSELTRIETQSFVISRKGEVSELVRGHPRQSQRPLTNESLESAVNAASDYIVRSQRKDGLFTYKLNPYSGKQDKKGFNLPRQAGTTFALCEHGAQDERTNRAIKKALRFMAKRARKHGERAFLTKKKRAKRAHLGQTALPLIAFAACRDRVGGRYDKLMGKMGMALLSLQDERGVFASSVDRKTGEALEGPEALFAEGQAIFALSLMEKLAAADDQLAAKWPGKGELHQAVERGMGHYAHDYWTHPLAQFFWIEENWHCLAAAASLEHHRHEGYEQMCLDYNRYKLRLSLDDRSGVVPEFLGAYGFGNVIAPHNTATAGLGEGLAAGVEIAAFRGEDSADMRRALRGVQAFLLAQQWREDETFGLKRKPSALGGWSESMVSPIIRIDYVQHAMAALASGREALAKAESPQAL
jgi:hypothetical protein